MSTRNLDKIFRPQRVAVIGASDKLTEAGGAVLHNLLTANFRGVVYPVAGGQESVQGIQAYPNVAQLPRHPDLAVICAPFESVANWLEACGKADIYGVIIISGGFQANSAEEQQLVEIAKKYPTMRIIGPNSLGVINPAIGLNASFTTSMPKAGHLVFLSQSGALTNAVLDRAVERGLGFSCVVSLGKMLDVSFGDLIDYFGLDARSRAIILYMQTIEQARGFISAARAFARSKPIVAYKAGQLAEIAHTPISHTAAMAAEDAVYDAAFQRTGIVRVWEIDNIFDVAEVLACQRLPQGERLAIISNGRGPAIVAADALLFRKGVLADFEESTREKLRKILPEEQNRYNPVDVGDEAPPARFGESLQLVLADPNVDGVLVVLTPQFVTNPTATAQAVVEASKYTRKPVLAAWMGGQRVREGIQILNQGAVPTHTTPEQAVRAFMHLVTYARNLEILYETPREVPLKFQFNRRRLRARFNRRLGETQPYLTEHHAKCLLKAYEIPVCEACVAYSSEDAVKFAHQIGYPVVLKVLSPQIIHKIDVGGVALNLKNAEEVQFAFKGIMAITSERRADAQVEGVTVQKMFSVENGAQMILGAKKDPTFGLVIMVGMGGIATGVFQDRALGLPPLNERLCYRMLKSLRGWRLLEGYRGQPAVNVERLVEIMIRFSYLVMDYPEIQEIDVNPLLVTPEDVMALDAVAILDSEVAGEEHKPYHHLAIRPYPEEYKRQTTLKDGTPVLLRPIRPEDEPLWQRLLTSSSPESLRLRFRSLFKHVTHEMARQHCFIDYEREINLVGEIGSGESRLLIGVGGLIASIDEETAEFSVLVSDPWQGKGLGGMILDYCLKIAHHWGVKRIIAETDPHNAKMLTSFYNRGFSAKIELEDEVVYLHKQL